MSKRRDIDRLLEGLRPAEAPSALRARALRAAADAGREEPEGDPGRWERAWQSRPLRLSWLAAVMLLTALHLAITPRVQDLFEDRSPVREREALQASGTALFGSSTGLNRIALARVERRLDLESLDLPGTHRDAKETTR